MASSSTTASPLGRRADRAVTRATAHGPAPGSKASVVAALTSVCVPARGRRQAGGAAAWSLGQEVQKCREGNVARVDSAHTQPVCVLRVTA